MKTTYHDIAFLRDENGNKRIERRDNRSVIDCNQKNVMGSKCFMCDEIEKYEVITARLEPSEFGRLTLKANKELLATGISKFLVCKIKVNQVCETIRTLRGKGHVLFASYISHNHLGIFEGIQRDKSLFVTLVFCVQYGDMILKLIVDGETIDFFSVFDCFELLSPFHEAYEVIRGIETADIYTSTCRDNFLKWWYMVENACKNCWGKRE